MMESHCRVPSMEGMQAGYAPQRHHSHSPQHPNIPTHPQEATSPQCLPLGVRVCSIQSPEEHSRGHWRPASRSPALPKKETTEASAPPSWVPSSPPLPAPFPKASRSLAPSLHGGAYLGDASIASTTNQTGVSDPKALASQTSSRS